MKKLIFISIIVFLVILISCSQKIEQTPEIRVSGQLNNIEDLVATPENIQDFCEDIQQLKNCVNCKLTMEEWCNQ